MEEQKQSVRILHSDRKTCAIQICEDGTVLVRAPRRMSHEQIERLLRDKSDWITASRQKMKARSAIRNALPPLTKEEIQILGKRALEVLPPRVAYYAARIGVTYGRITVRHQISRFGSCSSEGNLSFNCLLMMMPGEVVDYVIVHELCHRKEMNHSAAFWSEVQRILPNYKSAYRWLKQNGGVLIDRMRRGSET